MDGEEEAVMREEDDSGMQAVWQGSEKQNLEYVMVLLLCRVR